MGLEARNPSGANVDLNLDASGNLLTSTASGSSVTPANNSEATLLASAARTAAVTTGVSDQTNNSGSSVAVFLNITVASGTGGLTLRITGKDPVSGNFFPLNAAPTAVNATGQYLYVVGPGCTSTGGAVVQASAVILPKTWRVEIAVGDSSSYTYSVGASIVN